MCVCVCVCVCVSVYVYVWRLPPHFNLTRLSVQAWIFVHIKLPGSADGEEALTVCGRRCLSEEKNKMRSEGEKGSGGGWGRGGRWETGRVGQEKHCAYWSVANTEIQDTDAGWGLGAGGWSNCPWHARPLDKLPWAVDPEEVRDNGEEGVTEERGWWEARLIKLFGVKHSHSLRSLPCSFNLLRCWHFITFSLIVASYSWLGFMLNPRLQAG